jgi:hypothetical protein
MGKNIGDRTTGRFYETSKMQMIFLSLSLFIKQEKLNKD